ncbi:major facilitator superfamily domain-containing protein [Leucosporidium creatinivorum]|uniref:Nitrate/nitrite transporter n=1 Tax=Leucosporidium creatinivorum TaxID=106004 RepID=A0A1Y2EN17_9BASI|nr:major facilitator superfamily domain-containing protein [Leucosporidium creatinivorum]
MLFCLGRPELNPLTLKSKQLPIVNPVTSQHGRVLFISWVSFCLSFMAWYSFPPLMKSIRADIGLTQEQVLNSNIVALAAGLCMRFIAGPLCDRFGPRLVMVGILFSAAIPCGLAGTITTVHGLYAIRFFIGIAGACFVPTVVWCTAFFDKNAVGSANGIAAGFGNAGGGITYFVMPAVYDSLRLERGHTSHTAWRIAFIVPTILLIACGLFALLCCQDTPTGRWADRHEALARLHAAHGEVAHIDEEVLSKKLNDVKEDSSSKKSGGSAEVNEAATPGPGGKEIAPVYEVVLAPTLKEVIPALMCPQTLMLALPYVCTFGGELAINAILSAYYLQHQPQWGQTKAGQWAAMFGLLNVVTRPAGGIISDLIYRAVGPKYGVQSKKFWYAFLTAGQGVMALWVGLVDSPNAAVMVFGIAAIALFMDAANGAAYSLLPHVNPQINGVLSGLVGASGNLGGLLFSVGFRFTGSYARGIWIIGVCS